MHTRMILAAATLPRVACTMDLPTYVEKLSPSGATATAPDSPLAVIPQRQTEPHTRGYHALAAICLAYGLDPESFTPLETRRRLRHPAREDQDPRHAPHRYRPRPQPGPPLRRDARPRRHRAPLLAHAAGSGAR